MQEKVQVTMKDCANWGPLRHAPGGRGEGGADENILTGTFWCPFWCLEASMSSLFIELMPRPMLRPLGPVGLLFNQ